MAEIVPGLYQLKVPIPNNPLGYLNSYLLQGRDGWLLVDTGWYEEASFQSLKEQLAGLGLGLKDISQIVITHIHADHYGLAGRIKKESSARLLIHEKEKPFIQSRYVDYQELVVRLGHLLRRHGVPEPELPQLQTASLPVLQFVEPAWPDIALQGGEVISIGPFNFQVLWTPGHSSGHICLYEKEKKLLLSGDHVLPVITPNVSYHVESTPDPLGDYIQSLYQVESLPVQLVLPAHEHIFTGLQDRVKEILQHHETRKATILEHIQRKPLTAYVISGRIPWQTMGVPWEKLSALDKRMAVTETLAHLFSMEGEGRVRSLQADGVVFWLAK